jgi:hypothetical protein
MIAQVHRCSLLGCVMLATTLSAVEPEVKLAARLRWAFTGDGVT